MRTCAQYFILFCFTEMPSAWINTKAPGAILRNPFIGESHGRLKGMAVITANDAMDLKKKKKAPK